MEPLTRRSFLTHSAVGAVGVLGVAGIPGAASAVAGGGDREGELAAAEIEALARPVVVQVRDVATGEVEILVGDRSVVFTDKRLVAKVLRAAR